MENKIVRKLIEVEIRLGFLSIPAAGLAFMPQGNSKITVRIDNQEKEFTYNAIHKRIFGLTKWYKGHKVKVGDKVILNKSDKGYKIQFEGVSEKPAIKEAEALIDISGISPQAKGNIVEDRIKELIILQGQGLLSVYRPVTDTEGVDLIVTKSGMFQPIFLQVKGRFNVQKTGYFLMDISKKTFNAHHSYFVIGAYFNPEKIEIDDYLLLVPSHEVAKAQVVKPRSGERYRIANHLNPESQGRWAKYLIKKSELANKLIEKFEEIGKYIK